MNTPFIIIIFRKANETSPYTSKKRKIEKKEATLRLPMRNEKIA